MLGPENHPVPVSNIYTIFTRSSVNNSCISCGISLSKHKAALVTGWVKPNRAAPTKVTEPPMLRASWDLIVEASCAMPGLIVPESPPAKIAEYVVSGRGWLVWQPPADAQDTSRVDARLEVVRSYVQAQGQGRTPPGSAADMLASVEAAPAPAELDEASRTDLSRALGMPRATLDDMLKRL